MTPPDPVYVRALLAERQHLRHRLAVLLWSARRARREAEIARCQTPTLPYLAWHDDADRRVAAGERQVWCSRCERYKWPDVACARARVEQDERD